jgi:hypothetical protein
VLGWHDNVETFKPLTDSSKSKTGSLFADPSAGDGLIRIEIDSAGSAIFLEYRNAEGYNDPDFTGADDSFEAGVYAQFRPSLQTPWLETNVSPVQSITWGIPYSIVAGETVQLEDQLGITVQVTAMTSTKADYKVTWR